jgi:hypothetical protein
MKIVEIKKDKFLRDRVVDLIASLPADEVLTSKEIAERLNLTGINGRMARILSSMVRKSVIAEGTRQWAYGTTAGLKNLEVQINRGSIENR